MYAFFDHFDNRDMLIHNLDGQKVVGLIGEAPSKSAAQNAAWNHMIQALGLHAIYLPFDLAPSQRDVRQVLKQAVTDAQLAPSLRGFKVAPPYKNVFYELLEDSAEGAAKRLGVVNTVAKKNGGWVCANTDGEGMHHNLLEAFGSLDGKTFLLLGAGGAATTISDCLVQRAGKIMLAARNVEQAVRLKQSLEQSHVGKKIEALPLERVPEVIGEADCVINTTPVGRQGPLESFSSLVSTDICAEENIALSNKLIESLSHPICFASTLYRPEKELLLQQAERHGHRVVNGLGMWLYQAAVAARDVFFPDELSGVPLPRIAAALREGLSAFEQEELKSVSAR